MKMGDECIIDSCKYVAGACAGCGAVDGFVYQGMDSDHYGDIVVFICTSCLEENIIVLD